MFINWKLREINLKIVYYGPALSGKTTTLQQIHAKTNPDMTGDMVSLKTRGDRTIYFDFMQLELGEISGLKPRFNVYTVPGQVYYASTRKLVLQGADGVVFVADSQKHRLDANAESARDMAKNLRALGLDPRTMPVVLQCNKRDLNNIAPVPEVRKRLGMNGVPTFKTIATEGVGVFDGLKATINLVVSKVQKQI
jgi:hypothetical protein